MGTDAGLKFREPYRGEQLTEIARWIWQDHSDFYGIFCGEETEATSCIEALLKNANSDLTPPLLAVTKDQPIGVMCYFPLAELASRSLASLRLLMNKADDERMAIQKGKVFSSRVPPILGGGLYLARIAVTEYTQSQGVGSAMIRELEKRALSAGFSRICMHVRKSNEKAVRFYHKNAYKLCSNLDMPYISLEKHIGLQPYHTTS